MHFLDKKTKIESLIYDKIKEGEIRTPVSIIYDDINFVNQKITEYNSFYCDIKKEGILLYDSKRCEITNSYNLTSKEKKEIAKKEFEHWWGKAERFLENSKFNFEKSWYNESAFMLHQTVESLYNAILFVFTFYTPKTHDLKKLSASVNPIDKGLAKIFPINTKKWTHLFELLRKAYVDSRYNPTYKITEKELTEIEKRILKLQELTEKICKKKIEEF